MRKFIVGMALFFLLIASAFAEVEIPEDKRVKNFSSGCCVWCAVENLGNVHNIVELKGLAKYRHDNYGNKTVEVHGYYLDAWGQWMPTRYLVVANEAPGTYSRVKEEFARLRIKYKIQDHGNLDTKILKEAVDKNLGCAVGLKNYPRPGDYHMVTLTDLNDQKFVFVENNGKCGRYEKTREWFDQHWFGFTILVYPPEKVIK